MKKQLPTDTITNELSGASVFFQKASASPEAETQTSPPLAGESETTAEQHSEKFHAYEINEAVRQPQDPSPTALPLSEPTDSTIASNHATMPPHNQTTAVAPHQEPLHPDMPEAMLPIMLEAIRKTVKQVGKEAATYRLTEAEKQHLADIVYTYKRRGYRTSDNELARIAINWLILDYQDQGEQSVLARVLEALHR